MASLRAPPPTCRAWTRSAAAQPACIATARCGLSLFRSVPRELSRRRVRGLFDELRHAWGDVPFVVVNDGDVTALAGSMLSGVGALLGIALGSSQAAGYVTADGRLTGRLNELAFVPIDFAAAAPVDEWSGDLGCGAQYLSQQAVARLLVPAGIDVDPASSLPERLVRVQELAATGPPRDRRVRDDRRLPGAMPCSNTDDLLRVRAPAAPRPRDDRQPEAMSFGSRPGRSAPRTRRSPGVVTFLGDIGARTSGTVRLWLRPPLRRSAETARRSRAT